MKKKELNLKEHSDIIQEIIWASANGCYAGDNDKEIQKLIKINLMEDNISEVCPMVFESEESDEHHAIKVCKINGNLYATQYEYSSWDGADPEDPIEVELIETTITIKNTEFVVTTIFDKADNTCVWNESTELEG